MIALAGNNIVTANNNLTNINNKLVTYTEQGIKQRRRRLQDLCIRQIILLETL
ncbi:hypothetical [Yersinia pestis KIM10+]|uniref:Uncharacterized protein n=1 Tax=Yersinia pestis TaxID=632 RepID=Q8CL04_YERPE|nr:hypothetical [Yersinia pestis KIM10+]